MQEALSIVNPEYIPLPPTGNTTTTSTSTTDANTSTDSDNTSDNTPTATTLPTPGANRISKPKYKHLFDMVFVGSRGAQIIQENYFHELLSCNSVNNTNNVNTATNNTNNTNIDSNNSNTKNTKKSIVAVEGAKYLIPLSDAEKTQYDTKIDEYINDGSSSSSSSSSNSKGSNNSGSNDSDNNNINIRKQFVSMNPPPIQRRVRELNEHHKNQDVLFYISDR